MKRGLWRPQSGTLNPRYSHCKHLTICCFDFCLHRRWETLLCVLSACLLLLCIIRLGQTKHYLQKPTLVNCQGLKLGLLSSPLCQKALLLFLMCRYLETAWYHGPAIHCIHSLPSQLTSVMSLHKWILPRLHEIVMLLRKYRFFDATVVCFIRHAFIMSPVVMVLD